MKARTRRSYERLTTASEAGAWTFPLLLAVTVVTIVWVVTANLAISTSPLGDALSARLMWAVSAMLFATVFVFAIVQCHILMFRCGRPADALAATVLTTVGGLTATVVLAINSDWYLGPSTMERLLTQTVFSVTGIRTLTGVFDGFAAWAALVILATSCTLLRNDEVTDKELSRQIRASRILLYVGSALLITGVTEVNTLHTWPAQELDRVAACCQDLLKDASNDTARRAFQTQVQTTALAISSMTGMACSLVLAAAYLPLGLLLRQRAYRVVTPWERTEAWLVMHGLSLRPVQQLGKVLLMLGPLIAGGPAAALLRLITQ